MPSLGFDTEEQHRDDVGFIDHLIGVLLDDDTIDIDPGAIYVVGGSNGGMMTQRAACHAGDSTYPQVGRVAAFGAMVSTLPEGLYEGLAGRPSCPRAAGAAWVTTGGGHMLGSTREDFAPDPRAWWFVSSFRRDAAGALSRLDPTWMTGVF